ncbi:hypothetical protein FQA39_LY14367 [Lamprigera yunnana]|nr:hypothetical protein FQA39_LY14367 [Lamprigera yunnana]
MVTEITNLLENSDVLEEQLNHLFNKNCYDEIQDKVVRKKGQLPDKQFMARNSLLTDLLEITHIQTIYHIFIAILFGLFVNSAVYNILRKRDTTMGLGLVLQQFGNIHTLFYCWIGMFAMACSVYTGFHIWASIRLHFQPKSLKLKLWDKGFLCIYIGYFFAFLYVSTSAITTYNLSVSESLAGLCEITRFFMKTYAFVRSNVPGVLQYKLHAELEFYYPEFSKYLYFLFVPTLIYKNEYPRTKSIQWKYVVNCFIEVLGCIFYASFIIEQFLTTDFQNFGLKPMSWQEVTLIIMGNGMAGILLLLTTFYAVLHSWMNGFAEMLRFGDRMFYKDWWTSTSFGRYYRTWNVVVHDWLYTYVYKDMCEIVMPKNKFLPKVMVFFISAVFHEYILGFGFKFFLPVLFILFFGLGVGMYFLKPSNKSLGNAYVWYSLAVGTGICVSAYAMEVFFRFNCPIEEKTFITYFIPRFLTCKI